MDTTLIRIALSLSLLALTACYKVEPGPVTRTFAGNVPTVEGSFVLKKTLFGHSSMRGGGCLTYADLDMACTTQADCGSAGHCLAYTDDSMEKVCWRGTNEPSSCILRPTAATPLVPGETHVVTHQQALETAPSASYWRVITCQPFENASCHKLGPDGKKLYKLTYGPVRAIYSANHTLANNPSP